jgi:predicted phosphodiesterase
MPKIFIVGDLHMPYHNRRALRRIYEAIKNEKPTHIVQIGDLFDQYSFSRFSKKNITTSTKELRRARECSNRFWIECKKRSKSALCFQLFGNHDIRLTKRIAEKVPEAYELVKNKLNEIYTFKGVRTIYDDTAELKIHGITFMHGYRSRAGDHMRYNGSNTVVGHSHTGSTIYEQRNGKIIWELNAGYCADERSEPLKYRPQTTSKWTLGYGLITWKGGLPTPSFIPIRSK